MVFSQIIENFGFNEFFYIFWCMDPVAYSCTLIYSIDHIFWELLRCSLETFTLWIYVVFRILKGLNCNLLGNTIKVEKGFDHLWGKVVPDSYTVINTKHSFFCRFASPPHCEHKLARIPIEIIRGQNNWKL